MSISAIEIDPQHMSERKWEKIKAKIRSKN
jgi:anion-transporting  ArsA/GET3 family ATPase